QDEEQGHGDASVHGRPPSGSRGRKQDRKVESGRVEETSGREPPTFNVAILAPILQTLMPKVDELARLSGTSSHTVSARSPDGDGVGESLCLPRRLWPPTPSHPLTPCVAARLACARRGNEGARGSWCWSVR